MIPNEYINDNFVYIIPNNIKKKVILFLNSLDKLYDIKIYTFDDIKRHLLFDYDNKTLYYLVNKYNISLNGAKEYIDNIYYLLEKPNNNKLEKLNEIKLDLINNNLLIIDNIFKKALTNKNIVVFGFDYINKYNHKLLELLDNKNIKIINKVSNDYKHQFLEFKTINDEIEFVANDIINNKLDLSHVFIANINNDNKNIIKRIFNNYHLNINLNDNTRLYDTFEGLDYLNTFNLENIKNQIIKECIINVLNKYYFIDDKSSIKNLLEDEFKNTKINNTKYKNAINIIDLKDNIIDDEDHIYLINFNNEYIPINYKDEDFINDNEKPEYLEKTIEKNNIEINNWNNIIGNIKNLTISFSDSNYKGSLYPSIIINDEIIKKEYSPSCYSNTSNLYNLSLILDDYYKYNINNNSLNKLINTYPNINYLKYNNKYKTINMINKDIKLSYSKMNTYFECPFKYYLDNILKLTPYEDTFDTYLGSLCHFILSKIYNSDFDFEKEKNEFKSNSKYNLTLENIVFENKILNELKTAINYILSHYNVTKYKEIECERKIDINIDDVLFTGIIDKVMKFDNNIVLVDYKTGTPDIDLRLCNYGLNLQLPTYIYLIKSIYPSSNIVGIYLEHIVKPMQNNEFGKNDTNNFENSLKLAGYTLGDENKIIDFDPTYENSDFIKGMKMTANGFSNYTKVLTNNEFMNLEKLTISKINECINNIKNANFKIEPKIKGTENISCQFCPYKSICFVTLNDEKIIYQDKELGFLGGDNND